MAVAALIFAGVKQKEMERIIHVIDNCSAEGTLREMFRKEGIEEATICFPYPLYYGEVPTKNTYSDCVDKTFRYFSQREKKSFKDSLSRFYSVDFSEYDKVIVWHSNDSRSQFVLFLMASIIADDIEKDILYEVDLTKVLSPKKLSHKANPIDHTVQTGVYTCSEYSKALKLVSKIDIDSERMDNLASMWLVLLYNSGLSPWRFLENDEIVMLNEEWMDEAILEQLSHNPSKHNIGRDIVELWYKIDHVVGDYPVFARIKDKEKEWGYHIIHNYYIEKQA